MAFCIRWTSGPSSKLPHLPNKGTIEQIQSPSRFTTFQVPSLFSFGALKPTRIAHHDSLLLSSSFVRPSGGQPPMCFMADLAGLPREPLGLERTNASLYRLQVRLSGVRKRSLSDRRPRAAFFRTETRWAEVRRHLNFPKAGCLPQH